MTDNTLVRVVTSCASDPTDLDRLAASLEALALTFGNSDKQNTKRRGEEQRQHFDGAALGHLEAGVQTR